LKAGGFPTDNRVSKISVIGLGKLGAPLAACFASKGFEVVGVDVSSRSVRLINEGVAPVFEPGLQELLNSNRERLTATEDCQAAVAGTDVTFIVVPTPSDKSGGFSLEYVLQTCEGMGKALSRKKDCHLVVLSSTVLPGSTGGEVKRALERVGGKRCGESFGLCYSPEFIALGSVIRNFLNPDFILMGESDERAGDILSGIYKRVCDNDPPIARMSFVNAELTKLLVNSFVTTKITFANTVARICEHVPGADADVVSSALGLDKRIGHRYLKGAIGYGGPCFPRDNAALAAFARRVGVAALLAETTDRVNREQVVYLAELVKAKLPQGGKVGILGLSYKPDTDVVEESQALQLAGLLANQAIPVSVYDPASLETAKKALPTSVTFSPSAQACISDADVIVVATPWDEFKGIGSEHLPRDNRRRVFLDCWRIVSPGALGDSAEYISLGTGSPAA
jgi:UDPglucose 6-dehydrogenase